MSRRPEEGPPHHLHNYVSLCGYNVPVDLHATGLVAYDQRGQVRDWERQEDVRVQSPDAVDLHWRRAEVGHDADAGDAGRPSRR